MDLKIGNATIIDFIEIETDDEGNEIGEIPLSIFGILIEISEEDYIIRKASRRHFVNWISKNMITEIRKI